MSEQAKSNQLMSSSHRRLTPLQKRRLEALLNATDELASEGGYLAVTMRSVADKAGVGLATLYRYFASKDHLIAEAGDRRTRKVLEKLGGLDLDDAHISDRAKRLFKELLAEINSNKNVSAAGVMASTSGCEYASSSLYWERTFLQPMLEVVLDDDSHDHHFEMADILGHVFFSLAIGLTTGRMDLEQVHDIMERSVRTLLGESESSSA